MSLVVNRWWTNWNEIVISLSGLGLAFLFAFFPQLFHVQRERVSPAQTWAHVATKASDAGLDPYFVYSICVAESSLRPDADSGYARGMMQMSLPAWRTVSDAPWVRAYNWRANIEAGVDYLSYLKGRLREANRFSYPRLAAAYRYGYGALLKADFDVSRMPKPHNKIYRSLFAGDQAQLAPAFQW